MRFIIIQGYHFSYSLAFCMIGFIILLPSEVVFLQPITILLPPEVVLCSLSGYPRIGEVVYMLQLIFGISQSLGLTEPTSQSIRLPDTTSQYIGLPKNISHSLGLPKKYFNFSHTLTEVNVSVITASLYPISYINPSRSKEFYNLVRPRGLNYPPTRKSL